MTQYPMTTTLNRIRAHSPCQEGWENLLKGIGKTILDDDPLPYADILRINGLDDTIWCFKAEDRYNKQWRLFGVWCARQVIHLSENKKVDTTTLEVATRYAEGNATATELAASWAASWAASRAASWAASRAASWAASRAASEAAQTKYLKELFNSPT